ncbi:MAG: VCBS repeat-containing protein [Vicinamibacteria bacterium]|nr:VCBS repeat-containing protein [Vicinamibacteria bacterium]
MNTRLLLALMITIALGGAAIVPAAPEATSKKPSGESIEAAHRANNRGVALLEQFAYAQAVEVFREALALDPTLTIARINLAIALLNLPDLPAAVAEARRAVETSPSFPNAHYIAALSARAENRVEDAINEFRRVLAFDPEDIGAIVNLGQLHLQERRYEEAEAAFRRALKTEPYNATSLYNLALTLNRKGAAEEARRLIERFRELRATGLASNLGQTYPDQGRYAEALVSSGLEPALVDTRAPDVRFDVASLSVDQPAPERTAAESGQGGIVLLDADGDGDLDLLVVGNASLKLLRNDGRGAFSDITKASNLPASLLDGIGALPGDLDNDGKPDLVLLQKSGILLFRGNGESYIDVTAKAALPALKLASAAAALVDIDHDGDLDILLAGVEEPATGEEKANAPSRPRLLRNNGDGAFTDVTDKTGWTASGIVRAVVATDYDNRRDIDVLFLSESGPSLFANLRDGSFNDVTSSAGLEAAGRFTHAAAADANKDGFTDFFLGRIGAPALFAMSDGRGHFQVTEAPPATAGTTAAQFVDHDNDGLLDIIGFTATSSYVLRNLGASWKPVWGVEKGAGAASDIALGDLDGDGDADFVLRENDGRLLIGRNEGGNRHRSLQVRLLGRVSNKDGVSAKIEIRAGSLHQKFETYVAFPAPAPADVRVGLGNRKTVDAVRVLWPAGILQAETDTPKDDAVLSFMIKELDRKPSSCPYLFAWNGAAFEFISDFLGAGELGYWEAPGVFNHPDPDEYVRIPGDKLQERDGRYELRINNELEEAVFLDHAELLVVTHPDDVLVFPNEGMVSPPGRPFRIYGVRDARPPVRACDDHGNDLSDAIARIDRLFAEGFALHPVRGYAEEHGLILDLGAPRQGRTLLLLTGWTDYAFSSDNVAAHQSGLQLAPPVLEVRDASGGWQVVVPEIGVPVGRPQTIVLDVTDAISPTSREVRIRTNMRIYWDQILVGAEDERDVIETRRISISQAELRWRGFSAEVTPDGREPYGYDYERVSAVSPWKVMRGSYTRAGDVNDLLAAIDDRFVIARPGDEIALAFEALLPPPAGQTRTFLLHADGFSKEMDINSASPDTVTPLPFHGMTRYPYDSSESYPMTDDHRRDLEQTHTRVVGASVPRIEITIPTEERD